MKPTVHTTFIVQCRMIRSGGASRYLPLHPNLTKNNVVPLLTTSFFFMGCSSALCLSGCFCWLTNREEESHLWSLRPFWTRGSGNLQKRSLIVHICTRDTPQSVFNFYIPYEMDRRDEVIMHWNLRHGSPNQSVASDMRSSHWIKDCLTVITFICTERSSRKEKSDLEDKTRCCQLTTNWISSSICWPPCGAILIDL